MPLPTMGLLGVGLLLVAYIVYQYITRQKAKQAIFQHLDHIREHQVLVKPDAIRNTFSGRFAGRLMRFSFDNQITLITSLTIDMGDDALWIYPLKSPFFNDKLKAKLEKHQAWTGNPDFDQQFILAGRPRHFANAVIHPHKSIQDRLQKYPRLVVTISDNTITLRPNIKRRATLTSDHWFDLMGLIADIADSVEEHYEPEMFSGIGFDENAYPDHSGGHVS